MCGRWVGVHGLRSTVVCVHELELSIQPPAVARTSRTSLTQCTNTRNKLDRLPPLECYIAHSIMQEGVVTTLLQQGGVVTTLLQQGGVINYIPATRGVVNYITATRGCGCYIKGVCVQSRFEARSNAVQDCHAALCKCVWP